MSPGPRGPVVIDTGVFGARLTPSGRLLALANRTVAAFVARLKDAVDLDAVRDDLAGVVSQTLEPAHVSVWLNERR